MLKFPLDRMIPKIAYVLLKNIEHTIFFLPWYRVELLQLRWLLEGCVEHVIAQWWLLSPVNAFDLKFWTDYCFQHRSVSAYCFYLWFLFILEHICHYLYQFFLHQSINSLVTRIIISLVIKDQITCDDLVGRYILPSRIWVLDIYHMFVRLYVL